MFPILAAVIIALAAITFFAIAPFGASANRMDPLIRKPEAGNDGMEFSKPRFPTVEGRNTDGKSLNLPDEFEGLYNIALIAYDRLQLIDNIRWLHYIKPLETDYPDISVYTLVVVPEMSWFLRERLEFWLSSDIVDPESRASTITIPTAIRPFKRTLNIPNRSEIDIALVDRYGHVLWQERGDYTATKHADLENNIVNLLANVRIYA